MTPQNHSDVAIIGAGIMGLASAVALASKGLRVSLFESDRPGGPNGGSHGRARIIRLSYGDATYIRMAKDAFEAWRDAGDLAGQDLYRETGSLDIWFNQTESLSAHRAALTEAGVEFDILTSGEIAARHPQVDLPPGAIGLYQQQSAILHADLCVESLTARAVELGVSFQVPRLVIAIRPASANYVIETDDRSYMTKHVVLAAGRAVKDFSADLGTSLPLTISCEQVTFFEPRVTNRHTADAMPLLIFHLGDGVLSSVFPTLRDSAVKIMLENNGRCDLPAGAMDSVKFDEINNLILPHLPDISSKVVSTDQCHYVMTADNDFVIDRLPGHPRVVVCSACSGHGFKFAPIVGRLVADLVMDPDTRANPRFAIDRLQPVAGVN